MLGKLFCENKCVAVVLVILEMIGAVSSLYIRDSLDVRKLHVLIESVI